MLSAILCEHNSKLQKLELNTNDRFTMASRKKNSTQFQTVGDQLDLSPLADLVEFKTEVFALLGLENGPLDQLDIYPEHLIRTRSVLEVLPISIRTLVLLRCVEFSQRRLAWGLKLLMAEERFKALEEIWLQTRSTDCSEWILKSRINAVDAPVWPTKDGEVGNG